MYKTPKYLLKHETLFPISFHDTDAMGVMWHGNYIKFFESARESLFESIGFGYDEMLKHKLMFPISECSCKYRNFIGVLDKNVRIVCFLTEYDLKVRVHYEVYASSSDKLCAYGFTDQVIVSSDTHELLFETPECFTQTVKAAIAKQQ